MTGKNDWENSVSHPKVPNGSEYLLGLHPTAHHALPVRLRQQRKTSCGFLVVLRLPTDGVLRFVCRDSTVVDSLGCDQIKMCDA